MKKADSGIDAAACLFLSMPEYLPGIFHKILFDKYIIRKNKLKYPGYTIFNFSNLWNSRYQLFYRCIYLFNDSIFYPPAEDKVPFVAFWNIRF